jgi:hypothetical protein
MGGWLALDFEEFSVTTVANAPADTMIDQQSVHVRRHRWNNASRARLEPKYAVHRSWNANRASSIIGLRQGRHATCHSSGGHG